MVDEISRTAVASIYGLPEPLDDATWTRDLRRLAPLPDVGDGPAPHGLAAIAGLDPELPADAKR